MQKVPATRAVVQIAVGVMITFNQSHSAATGLLSLAIFGVAFAVANSASALWAKQKPFAIESLPFSITALVVGLFAVFVPQAEPAAQALAFVYLVAGWGIIAGATELYLANRAGFKTRSGKDMLINSVLGLAIGVLFLIAPLDIVSAVGFFGAYLVISGVHLAIASLTPQK